ncbi:MAG: hypothetical protein ACI9KS_001705 [Sulfitobacter sp.]|jgi:hypothetical protein
MEIATDDRMTAFVIEALVGTGAPHPALVTALARAFPQARALELSLALASAAEGLAAMISGGLEQAHALYRLATLVAIDTLVLEVQGQQGAITAAHLLTHWEGDIFFNA